MEEQNVTRSCDEIPATHNEFTYIYTICYHILLPLFTANGVIGNIINLVVLRAKRVRLSMGSYEKRTNYGLIALALSDLLMCLFAFPTSMLFDAHIPSLPGFSYYYQLYGKAIINVFIMSSTWLTVTLAAERYLAICHTFKARSFLKISRTLGAIVFVFVFSALFNIPYLWKMKATQYCTQAGKIYYLIVEKDFPTKRFEHTMRVLWAILGNFIPLILLAYFNFRLMLEIHKTYKCRHHTTNTGIPEDMTATQNKMIFKMTHTRKNQNDQGSTSGSKANYSNGGNKSNTKYLINQQRQDMSFRITLTLVAIVIMFLILVAPSEAVKHILYLVEGESYITENQLYLQAEIVTNTMQTLNFSVNFIIYCCIIKSFRRTIKHIVLDRIGLQCRKFFSRIRKCCTFRFEDSDLHASDEYITSIPDGMRKQRVVGGKILRDNSSLNNNSLEAICKKSNNDFQRLVQQREKSHEKCRSWSKLKTKDEARPISFQFIHKNSPINSEHRSFNTQ